MSWHPNRGPNSESPVKQHGIQTESSELGAAVDDDADVSDAAAGRGVVEEVEEGGGD